jgi:hypothetical protein
LLGVPAAYVLRYLVVPLDFTVTMALFLSHTALVLPYAVRVVVASLQNLRTDIDLFIPLLNPAIAVAVWPFLPKARRHKFGLTVA